MNDPELQALLDAIAVHGKTAKGGLNRLAASREEGAARDELGAWLRAREFGIRVDSVGNLFATLELAGKDAPWVLTGSHLDSQPHGGRFDGAYGVIGACVAADRIRRTSAGGFRRNLAVVSWTNEEGARFAPSLLGSGVYAGQYEAAFARSRSDAAGITLGEALQAIGYSGSDQGPADPACYVELHIEQGPALERAGATIGVVEGNWGTVKFIVRFEGRAAHTGPTAMAERRDALLAAGHAIVACRALSDRTGGALLSSVGRLDIAPNSTNIVAGSVDLYAEFRAIDPAMLEGACAAFERAAAEAAEVAGVALSITRPTDRPAGTFDPSMRALIEAEAKRKGYRSLRLDTVAGHDAIQLRRRCPSAMIFVPSAAGISHNEEEFTLSEDLAAGVDVLEGVLRSLLSAAT
jgi:N-carbamoyl-L-amino-acid hydrolase